MFSKLGKCYKVFFEITEKRIFPGGYFPFTKSNDLLTG